MKKKILSMAIMICGLASVGYANDGVSSKYERGKTTHSYKYHNRYVKKVAKNVIKENEENRVIKDGMYISGRLDASKQVATIFPYYDDSNYEIFLKVDYVTMIKLEPNEDVLYIAGGNSDLFMVDQTRGGRDGSTYVYIKPLYENVKTNLVITTDKRVYHFTLNVNDDYYNNMVKFEYPLDREILSYSSDKAKAIESKSSSKSNGDINYFGKLDLNYRISSTKENFSPVIVYNDGIKTYIQMKKDLSELPVFYDVENGKEEITNQKVRDTSEGKIFIIDKVIENGRLKLGNKSVDFLRVK